MKKVLLFLCNALLLTSLTNAQVISTESGTGYTGLTTFSTGVAVVSFGIQNANAYPITLTQVDVFWRTTNSPSQGGLWYSATSLGGGYTVAGPEWIMIKGLGDPVTIPTDGYYPTITGINFIIPANTTYRFALQQSPAGRYSNASAIPNFFTVDGVTLHTQDALLAGPTGGNVGFAGGWPTPSVANTPRGFTGRIHFEAPLPVTLSSFTGTRETTGNVLKWTTLTEQNSKGFDVERSIDGTAFSSIGFIYSKADNGNSNHVINYTFVDVKANTTSFYYRLRQVDIDNKSTVSNTVVIKGEKVHVLTIGSFYPNPVREKLNVVIDAPAKDQVSLVITDLSGKQVLQQNVSIEIGSNTIGIDVNQLPGGNYIMKVQSKQNNDGPTVKFVKQ